MGKTDILTIVFGLVMCFMPMWTAVVVRPFFRNRLPQIIALYSVSPFFIWRLVAGDHLLFFEKVSQMDQAWMKLLFGGICILFGVGIPYLLALGGVQISDKLLGFCKGGSK